MVADVPELDIMVSDEDTLNKINGEIIISNISQFNNSEDILSTVTMEDIIEGLAMLEDINTNRSETVQNMITNFRQMLGEDQEAIDSV